MTSHSSKEVEKRNTHPLLRGVQTCTETMEISVVVPQESGIYRPKDSPSPFVEIFPKVFTSYSDIFVVFSIHNSQILGIT